ncbi:hypothetical protein QWI17_15820 [Gilvimarinus sp. SDUM040013]|uniref:Peptidase S74 domain-containing protein n=1 Tax=Gilvimarinus gilvus TaxID=3058038 RepID=A0ABU4RVU6_9GAMM|nr:hypothetical protein [Gilvimarinus sp. SDUM040013]MDO3387309.1 hypothetical protein [Gilvimarinus sp. SDUM040013]MDX6848998.1 hypothetical protein [Gilvimarinus sp. SDUM040013]
MNAYKKFQLTIFAAVIAATCSWSNAEETSLFESQILNESLAFAPKSVAGIDAEVDLIIKGPEGFYLRKSFQSGMPVEFVPAVMVEGGMPDGTYRYELQVMGIYGVTRDRNSDQPVDSQPLQGHSGTFSVVGGQIVNPNVEESPYKPAGFRASKVAVTETIELDVTAEQTFVQDVEIQGSLCVGTDCTSSENFGFDTLRLKENNLRIKFDDTSTSASFPNHDWQLTANDSGNGGANKFSIDNITTGKTPLTVVGNAPTNSLYISDAGNIGMGTSTPVVQAHMRDGNTPALRLEQDGSSGFTPQSWDVAGNETNFFIRDVTNGSKLPFRIKPNAPNDSIFVAADGDVGLGTDGPDTKLHVRGTSGSTAAKIEEASGTVADRTLLTMTNNGGGRIHFEDNSANDNDWVIATTGSELIRFTKVGSGGAEFELDGAGNITITGTLTTASNVYPDYVFKDGYALMPIREVEAFILENGHLPNIRPADEIIRDGLDLTEGHVKMMEKVEELTLYTIEQQKLIDELRSRLDELEDS